MVLPLTLRVLGLALFAAALLKAHGFLAPQFLAPDATYYGAWLGAGLIFAEALVGIWLVFSQRVTVKWVSACILLVLFSAANIVKSVQGETSCGCFGSIKANPTAVGATDALLLLLLLYLRPQFDGPALLADICGLLKTLGGGTVAFAIALFTLVLVFGSEESAIARIRRESCSITPEVVDFGAGRAGEIKTQRVVFRNWSEEQIQIIGGSSDCSFRSWSDLPIYVPPDGLVSIRVSLRFPKVPGRFAASKRLLFGNRTLSVVYFHVKGVTSAEDEVLASSWFGPFQERK